jgi:hypothetical protein
MVAGGRASERHGIARICGKVARELFGAAAAGDNLKGNSYMRFGFRGAWAAFAMIMVGLWGSAAKAGDDGAAPLWTGVSSIFSGMWGGGEKQDPIDYREHGKLVLPPKTDDLPPPGSGSVGAGADWPVNQEVQRKKAEKDAAKKTIAGVGDARLRYTHPFPPNTPVTVRATDHDLPAGGGATSVLGSLNPLSWVGMGKTVPLGPEPDREWLTDPPKGYRAPVEPTTGKAAN